MTLDPCAAGSAAQLFRLAANTGSNNPIGTGLQSTFNDGFLGLFNNDAVMRLQSKTVADRVPTIDEFVGAFSARIDRVDVLTRSAEISGTGTPGAKVFVDGLHPVDVRADGTWSTRVTGLSFGSNEIEVTQYEGTVESGRATLRIEVLVDALTFEAAFGSDRDAAASATGSAHPGAEVKLFASDGTQVGASTIADPRTGAWSTAIPAPNTGGTRTLTAAQFIDGVRDGAHDVTRTQDYGTAVSITSPADGAAHAGGPVEMSGTGEPGSAVEVHDHSSGGDVLIGAAEVYATGRWALSTQPIDRSEHLLEVVQRSKGANTTRAEITLNVGETGKLAPVRLLGPVTVTPGVDNVFTGTGEPQATYEVLNASGTPLVPGTLQVDSAGKWTFSRAVDWRAKEFSFVIRQTKDGVTETSELFTIAANSGFDPVTVTTETVKPGEVNTFDGTGPKGARYEVLNASGTTILPGVRTIDQNGRWSFERAVSAGQVKFEFKLRITIDGTSYTSKLFTVAANTR
ncbi:hypothetical protein [Curtobacterium pusillum]|uniref:hypothetical protein n=1 Tax=Curtobacterium pusillum TaxID=69373 RepID=UPI0011A909B7|nr:hypothetical protein [Curtobacterium pusillum]